MKAARTARFSNSLSSVPRARPYDLVVVDIQMPEMDGIAATQCIRAMGGAYETLPIIALTANAMKGDREQYLDALFDEMGLPDRLPDRPS